MLMFLLLVTPLPGIRSTSAADCSAVHCNSANYSGWRWMSVGRPTQVRDRVRVHTELLSRSTLLKNSVNVRTCYSVFLRNTIY